MANCAATAIFISQKETALSTQAKSVTLIRANLQTNKSLSERNSLTPSRRSTHSLRSKKPPTKRHSKTKRSTAPFAATSSHKSTKKINYEPRTRNQEPRPISNDSTDEGDKSLLLAPCSLILN